MSQVIPVTGKNKDLLRQSQYLSYKAQIASNKNRWNAYTRLICHANQKLIKVATNLKIDLKKYDVLPNISYCSLVLIEREGQA